MAPGTASVHAVVAAAGADTSAVMREVEERMARLVSGHGHVLGHHARSTVSAGGKRLRPLLVFLASGVPVCPTDRLIRAAVAVELIHAATLVHDDVLDGSSLRRGRPTVVASGGRLLATATGDLLFARAFAELAAGGAAEPVRILSRSVSALAAGELMQRDDAWNASVSVKRYFDRCRLKTAVLFRAACELGAEAGQRHRPGDGAAGRRTRLSDSLGNFGESIGLAFQLLDDILDVTGPPERTGKPRGADLLDGTVTLPLIEARELDPSLATLDLRSLRTAEEAAAVCDRIAATGALESAREQALGMVLEAKATLPELPEFQQSALELVADGVVERYS